jgi:hypothetical protein
MAGENKPGIAEETGHFPGQLLAECLMLTRLDELLDIAMILHFIVCRRDVVFVSHCPRGNRIRIVGARRATRKERKQYEEDTYY